MNRLRFTDRATVESTHTAECVVAEGVETAEQRDLLYEMGCSHAQGYLYAQPVPGSEVPCVLAGNQKLPSLPRTMASPDRESSRIETQLQNLDHLMSQP